MTEHQYQQFRLTDIIEKVCVTTADASASNSSSSCYVSLEDIQDVFPEAMRFKLNGDPIPFLKEPDGTRIQPLRIAFYRDKILDVIIGPLQSNNQFSRDLLLTSSNLDQSPYSSHIPRSFEQAEMIKYDPALNQSTLEKHIIENTIENKELLQEITSSLREAKVKDDKMLALQQEMLVLQLEAKKKDEEIISLQNQALDRLAILQKHAQAILVQNFELHEYPIPRFFIILPVDQTKWNPKKILENKFRLHFLCECGDHTVKASKTSQNNIHIAKHEGYEIRNGTEFFS
ncbi:hypothetical protein BGX27_002350, partial [Mortierella sp. AM989]